MNFFKLDNPNKTNVCREKIASKTDSNIPLIRSKNERTDIVPIYPEFPKMAEDMLQKNSVNDATKEEFAYDNLLEKQEMDEKADVKVKEVEHTWRNLIIIMSVLNVLLLSASFLLFFVVPSNNVQQDIVMSEPHYDDDICVSCDNVYLTSDDVRDNIYEFEQRDSGTTCCVGKTSSLSDITSKVADKLYREHRAQGFGSDPQTEVHMQVNSRTAVLRDLDLDQLSGRVLKWKTNQSLIGQDTYYKDGRLHVNVPGIYYIYSQVVFVDDGEKDLKLFKHSLWLHGSGNEEKLMEAVHSEWNMTPIKDAFIPSFNGGLFQLQAYDGVEVRVSDFAHININNNNFNFGLHYVSPWAHEDN